MRHRLKASVLAIAAAAVLAAASAATAEPAAAEPRLRETARRTFPPMPRSESPVINTGENARTREVATRAWRLFQTAWATGDWQPFFDITTDDFQFYFPQGEFAGLHQGRAGKERLVAWGNYHRQAGNRVRSVATHVTIGGNTALFENTSTSIPEGAYRNYEAVVFEVRGDRISALREYWNVLQPGSDPSGN
jgi:ketosteroid isomerase-like protein